MRVGSLFVAALAVCAGSAAALMPAGGAWHGDLPAALVRAERLDRPVLIHFSAAWCGPCRRMEPVLNSPVVARRLADDAVGVSLDFDAHRDVAARYGVASIPADVLLSPDGRVLGVMSGFKTAPDYARRVAAVAGQYRDQQRRLTPARPVRAPDPRRTDEPTDERTGVPEIALLFPDDSSWDRDPVLPAPAKPEPAAPAPDLPPPGGAFGDSAPRYDDFQTPQPVAPAPVTPRRTDRPVLPDPFAPDPEAAPDAADRVPGRPYVARRPAGRKLLGMRGYCPVTLHRDRRWVRGDRQFAWEHQGVTYFLADADTFAAFVKAAEDYAPRLLGCDPVLYRDEGRAVPGKTEHAAVWKGHLFLFASAKTRRTFADDPTAYAASRQVLLIEEIEGIGTF